MFSKHILNPWIKFRYLFTTELPFRHHFVSLDNKLIKSGINNQRNVLMNVRPFCHQINDDFNQKSTQIKPKPIDKQNEKSLEIRAKKIPKRSEFFYIILKKPSNQLIQWIEKTPPQKKKNIIFSAIIKYLIKPFLVISMLYLVFVIFNSDVNPITGRDCVYALPEELANEIENDIFKEIFTENLTNGKFLHSTDPLVKRLDNCFERLIKNNSDLDVLGTGVWNPVVINDDNICDVIVLKESQNVFVYKKMLELCQTDDELAYVLAHQLSHLMLDHRREPTTHTSKLFLPLLALLPKMWILEKDPVFRFEIFDVFDTFVENSVKRVIRKIVSFSPYNEELEEEADRIAMQLMTRSCFDIRKCRQFCKKYKSLSGVDPKVNDQNITKRNKEFDDFFVKHPITEQKLLYLFQYIKPFIELRKVCNCQPLV